MCGIAGKVTTSGAPPDEALLRRFAGALAHRGPDSEGVWSAPGVGLAHRRLAIIDLSPRGAQPMTTADGRFTIVFNGEIYNYRELRAEINASWRSDADTEIILEGYRKWGTGIFDRLRGMFALAIWDAEERTLVFARDKIGKKPLFYSKTPEGLVFASELKAFDGVIPMRPDLNAVRLFLGLQYVPSPRTGFENILQLEPGHFAEWKNGQCTVTRYHEWKTDIVERSNLEIDGTIHGRLEDAVRARQLASDVPVGAFLSGGVDSAAVVAYAVKQSPHLKTFTMGFPEIAMDERRDAEEIARYFGTDHHEFEARPEHLTELVETLVQRYDAPYADSSALPLWLLARETSKHIKVVLTGDGGDETFGGYRRYAAYDSAVRAMTVPFVPYVLPQLTSRIGALLHDPRFERMGETVRALRLQPETAYGEMFCGSYFGTKGIAQLCAPEFLAETARADAVNFVREKMRGEANLEAAMRFDLTSYLPDDLNVKMDRATMAFGLEARSPFLDQDVVQYALSLPLNQKVAHGKTKVALKRALTGVVPDGVLNRAKRGFQVPLAAWFRGPLAAYWKEQCLDPHAPLSTIVRSEMVARLYDENLRGADHGNRLWMLLALNLWLKRHV